MSRWILFWLVTLGMSLSASGQYLRVDTGFVPDVDGWVWTIGIQPDGKILIGGQFTRVNGITRRGFARLNSNGSLDESIPDLGEILTNYVHRFAVTESNFYATAFNGGGTHRFSFQGVRERAYTQGANFTVDSQARLVYGVFTEWQRWERVARINENGTRDFTFLPEVAPCCLNKGVNAVAIQRDSGEEKILIGGDFTEVNTNRCLGLARLNDDGSVDTTFQGGTRSPVLDIKIWRDQFYVATDWEMTRHFADGTADPTFLGSSAGWNFQKIFPYPDGRVLALLRGVSSRLLRRHNADGSIDTNVSMRIEGKLICTALQTDEGIIIGGSFTDVNCVPRTYLARLIPSDTPDPLPCVPELPKPEPWIEATKLPKRQIAVQWQAGYPEYTLQATRLLRPRHPEKEKWVTVTNVPVCDETLCAITNKIARYGKHYRLVEP